MLENRALTPAAANIWVRILRILLDLAVDDGMIGLNPAARVKDIRQEKGAEP